MKIKSKLSKQIIAGLPLSIDVMDSTVTHLECKTPIVSIGKEITIRDVRKLTKNFKQSLYNNLITQEVFRSDIYLVDINVSTDTFNASGRSYLQLNMTLYGNGEIHTVLTNPMIQLVGCSWFKFKVLDEVI